jgi:hypothetical protein
MPPVNLAACDDSIRNELIRIFGVGCALSLFIVFRLFRSPQGGPRQTGLQLCYLANFWILHWVAMPVYFTPWYCGENAALSLLGARQSLYALIGLTVGVTLMPFLLGRREPTYGEPPAISAKTRQRFLWLGLAFYVFSGLLAGVSGLSAVLVGGQLFLIAGMALSIWSAHRRRNYRTMAQWVAISIVFPFMSVIRSGFLGFGIAALLPVVVFALTLMPRKNWARLAIFGMAGAYLGLSLFVTYMRDRYEIRHSVWGRQSFSNRLTQLATTFGNFEWFSPVEPRHLAILDGRLNQNYLVGAAVVYVDGTKEWAAGKTLRDAALALIPRLIWPDKPVGAGSGDLVSRYTGLEFSEGTSVGIGQVMEFYVNFGSPMVFLGFFIIGSVLAWLDRVAANALIRGSTDQFIPAYLVGLSMLQVGGSLVEVVAAVAGSLVIAYLFNTVGGRKAARQPASRAVSVAG